MTKQKHVFRYLANVLKDKNVLFKLVFRPFIQDLEKHLLVSLDKLCTPGFEQFLLFLLADLLKLSLIGWGCLGPAIFKSGHRFSVIQVWALAQGRSETCHEANPPSACLYALGCCAET